MQSISIQDTSYNFVERTFKIHNNDTFKVKMIRYINESNKIISLVLLKSLILNINNEIISYKEFRNNNSIKFYRRYSENIRLINNISKDLNNNSYYNSINYNSEIDQDDLDEFLDENNFINQERLDEACIINSNTTYRNFRRIPIFHYNGDKINSRTQIICHFSILIDMICKVYSNFKYKMLEINEVVLNLAELSEEDIDTYLNKSKTELIKKIKSQNNEINEKNKELKKKSDKIDELLNEVREQSKKIDGLTEKIDSQTKVLTEVTEKLDKLVDNILKLDGHLTSNTICNYKIVLYTEYDTSNVDQKKIIKIKSFVGMQENIPDLTGCYILLEKTVSCSLDSFKTVLSKLNQYVIDVKYRSIFLYNYDLKLFILNFKSELLNFDQPVDKLRGKVKHISQKVDKVVDRVESLEEFFKRKYNLTDDEYELIKKGGLTCMYNKKYRVVYIEKDSRRLYVNCKNKIHYLTYEDLN